MTENKNYVNLTHGFSNTRIYKMDSEFFSYTCGRTSIIPFTSLTAKEMAEHIHKTILDEVCQVELLFVYMRGTMNKNKLKKMNALIKEEKDVSLMAVMKWVSLLL
jgi:hypothetical protein